MKVNESFAVEATEEVRKDPRFEWYVNWLKSLENDRFMSNKFVEYLSLYGITSKPHYHCGDWSKDVQIKEKCVVDEILTLDEVYSRYGKEIYEANGIEQPNEFSYRPFEVDIDWSTYDGKNVMVKVEEQPFQGSIEYDRILLCEWEAFKVDQKMYITGKEEMELFLNNRYHNESILKQIAEHKAKIEELRKQLNTKTK